MSSSRPFMDILREHRSGRTHDELSDALQTLVEAVTENRRSGEIKVTFSLKPAGKDERALELGCKIDVKLPKEPPGVSLFFATPENNLQRKDPRQEELDIRAVPTPDIHRSLAQ